GAPGTVPAATATTVPATTVPAGAAPTDVPVPDVTRPVRVVVVGDSTAQVTAAGLTSWAAAHPEAVQVADASQAGCGFLRSGEVVTDGEIDWQGQCDEALDVRLPPVLDELRPDVVMLMVTMRDVEDRSWDPAEGVLSPFDPRYRQRLLDDYVAFATRLRDAGVPRVAWVLPPHPIAPFQGEEVKMLDPARYEVQFDVIEEVAGRFPDLIEVLDVRAWSLRSAAGGRWRSPP
ncbi:MAG: SGNH hydrolase domain-containing protein, partial [Ilumatobacteraceae bacterium]